MRRNTTKQSLILLKISLLTLITAGLFNPLYAQDTKLLSQELQSLKERYEKEEPIAMKIIYKMFETATSTEVRESREARFLMNGKNNFYLENESSISVYDHGKTLLADKAEKNIFLLNQKQEVNTQLAFPTDSVLKLCSSIKLLKEEKGIKTYRLNFDSPFYPYSSIELTINTQKRQLHQLSLFYANKVSITDKEETEKWVKPRMEIVYITQEIAPSEKDKLKLSAYVLPKNETYMPTKAYQSYHITDNTQAR
jgi:hypothetical protein